MAAIMSLRGFSFGAVLMTLRGAGENGRGGEERQMLRNGEKLGLAVVISYEYS